MPCYAIAQRYSQAGCNDHDFKPIELLGLLSNMATLLSDVQLQCEHR
jgi:hypothetical protein